MTQYKQIRDDIYIGPQPTELDLQEAKRQGIRTVIDFRPPTETPTPNSEIVSRAGLDYVNVPVSKTALSTKCISDFNQAIKQKEGPYLLHCASGMRAAMLLALSRAKEEGWTAERTFEEVESMGFNLRSSPEFANFVEQSTASFNQN
jgi:uncharacterized protein (TIGR01244 family)